MKKYYCQKCNKSITKKTYLYGTKLCVSCCKFGIFVGQKRPDVIIRNKLLYTGKKLDTEHKIKISQNHHNVIGKNNPMYGRKHTYNVKKQISIKAKKRFRNPRNHPMYGKLATHGKGNYYKNIWMRSSWEIAYAKYLDRQHIKWLYESKIFDLGNTTYTPDFYLPETNTYIEIKGYWRDDAKKKFKLFQKIYNDIIIKILTKKELTNNQIL